MPSKSASVSATSDPLHTLDSATPSQREDAFHRGTAVALEFINAAQMQRGMQETEMMGGANQRNHEELQPLGTWVFWWSS